MPPGSRIARNAVPLAFNQNATRRGLNSRFAWNHILGQLDSHKAQLRSAGRRGIINSALGDRVRALNGKYRHLSDVIMLDFKTRL